VKAARALTINVELLYKWQKEALTPVAATRGVELDPATATELRQLRATNRRQAQELEILKNHYQQTLQARYLGDRQPRSRYHFIEAQRRQYPVRMLCQVVAVTASGYYAWQQNSRASR
jgi:hypothetical protein